MPAKFTLPPLPFDPEALAPAISSATFAQHHAGHHQAYVDKLNILAEEEGLDDASLVEIIRERADADPEEVSELISAGELFVHAAQHFNHSFYWKSLSPNGGEPTGELLKAIEKTFGSLEELKAEMVKQGLDHFASGWLWLVADDDELELISTHDAQTPLIEEDMKPLLVVDLWEHAYYLDHQRARKAYLEAVVGKHLNWEFAAEAFAADDVDELELGIDNG